MREGSTLSWGEKEGWREEERFTGSLEAEEGICWPGRTFGGETAAPAKAEPMRDGSKPGGCGAGREGRSGG